MRSRFTVRLGALRAQATAIIASSILSACSGGGGEATAPAPESYMVLLAGDTNGSVSTLVDATGLAARFAFAGALAGDAAGNLYVADTGLDGRLVIRKVSPSIVVTTLLDTGLEPGEIGHLERGGVATDTAGNVYAGDGKCFTGAHVHICSGRIRKIDRSGQVTTLIPGTDGRLGRPDGMAIDSAGNIYVADGYASAIRKVTPTGEVVTIAQVGLDGPSGIALDPAGNIVVADTLHSTILRVSPTGALTVLAGAVNAPGSTDGAGADARFNHPRGMVIDARGNLYVADTGNHTIRKITPSGVVTTIVGQAGMAGFRNGSLPGFLQSPADVALGGNDLVGNDLYITMPTALAVVRNRP